MYDYDGCDDDVLRCDVTANECGAFADDSESISLELC